MPQHQNRQDQGGDFQTGETGRDRLLSTIFPDASGRSDLILSGTKDAILTLRPEDFTPRSTFPSGIDGDDVDSF